MGFAVSRWQDVALVRRGVVLAVAIALAGCWPAPGQGPDRSAHNPFEKVITPQTVGTLAPVWTATTDGVDGADPVGPPVVSNRGVHVSDGSAHYAFDRVTGVRLWRHPDAPLPAATLGDPVADGDRVLFSIGQQVGFSGSWGGEATWFDARTSAPGETVADGPVLARRDSRLVTWSAVGGDFWTYYLYFVHVVDTADPAGGWQGVLRTTPGSAAPPPTLGARRLYVVGDAATSFSPSAGPTGVRAYPLTTPEACVEPPPFPWPSVAIPCPLWFTPTAAAPVTSPVLGPGETVLYVGTGDGTLLAVDPTDGHELWRASLGAAPSADPALADGWLYVPLTNGKLVVFPAGGCGRATCRPAWRAELGAAAVQPAVAGGVVFVGTDAGRVMAFSAADCGHRRCRPLWERDMGGAVTGAPAVTGGHVYLGVAPDRLVALAPT